MATTLHECPRCGEWAVYTTPQDSAYCDACVEEAESERAERDRRREADRG